MSGSGRQGSAAPASALRLFDVKALGTLLYEHVAGEAADVAVIIPLYNYEHYVEECLESVIQQDLQRLSIAVVDDCSTDGGGEMAVTVLKQHVGRFAAARVIRHQRNQGLAMSRNSGIVWSSEPFVFMLDADNLIRPPALSRLLEALGCSQAAFAYSQLCLFGTQHTIGSNDIWDPRRLVWGNYIDAMALIRREALCAAGGYSVLAHEQGWEDFDLWCRFAELGYSGTFLPELLGEYRVHDSSMLRTRTDKEKPELMAEMAFRHPNLFNLLRRELA